MRRSSEIRAASLRAFDIVGCSGWGRLDLILRDGRHVFVPRSEHVAGHDRAHSLVPMAAKQAGIAFADLCVEILRGAHVG